MNYTVTRRNSHGEEKQHHIDADCAGVEDDVSLYFYKGDKVVAVFHPTIWMFVKQEDLTGNASTKAE